MNKYLDKCMLCPRACMVNRNKGEVGYCGASNKIVIGKSSLHMWEEPCLSGDTGSGTIFFSYCNLRCIFCQNYDISTLHKGREISVDDLAEIMIRLQNKKANNINLVTPTHYVPLIIEAIDKARMMGLNIPIVYNSSGYESIDTIKMLEGYIDIYLPDFKYYSDTYAIKYSKAKDYFKYASSSLEEMYRQVGKPIFDNNGIMKKGIIVRHLLLPGMEEDSKKIIKYLYDKYRDNIYISIMNQYTPIRKLEYKELNNTVDDNIYDDVIDYAYDLGIRNAFIQDGGTQSESFIPEFNGDII